MTTSSLEHGTIRYRLTSRARRFYAYQQPILLPILTFGVVLVAWEVAASTGAIDTFFFSSPSGIAITGWEQVQLARFWNDVLVSGQVFLAGYILSVVIAIPFGLLTGWFRPLHYIFDPWLSAFNSLPRLALLPLIILWLGLGVESKIAIVFLGAFFPMALNTFHGVRTADATLLDVATSFGASTWRRLVAIVLPATVPFALIGMRIGIGRAMGGVVVGEFFTSQAGLGHMVFRAGIAFDIDLLLFGAVCLTLMALIGFWAVSVLERRSRAWRPQVGSA